MKKILTILASAALVFSGSTTASAELIYFDEMQGWGITLSNTASLSVAGSIKSGEIYSVNLSGLCPGGATPNASAIYVTTDPATLLATAPGGSVSTGPLMSGTIGTWTTFGGIIECTSQNFKTRFVTVKFEEPISVGTPTNFSVFPQAGGTAFATWGIADGADEYIVTATPGDRTCTTSQNFCVVSGLTPGASYDFSVVAVKGSARSATVSSGQVVLREPVTVAVGLSGGNWRVGDTVTAQYVVQGTDATPTITWYRCSGVVAAMPSEPVPGECASVGSGASYVLGAGDVGKYVTAHVFVNNTDPQGQMTASNMNAVLASGAVAPAPVADPAGKPTIVNIPNPIVSVAGGTEVTITGTGLAGVTSVTVGGLPAIVVSKTDTTVVVQVPVSTKTGLADLTITNDKGSATSKSAIVYTTNPVIKVTKTKTISGFAAGQKALTSAQKAAVKSLISANPKLTILSCAAKTTGVASNKTELAKAKALATATCAYAKTLNKSLVTSATATQTLPKSKASRSVSLTLKN